MSSVNAATRDKIGPIPVEELQDARLRFKRRLAALIISIMAEKGMTYDEIGIRIGQSPRQLKRYIAGLIDGSVKAMDEAVDLAYAMGCEIIPKATDLSGFSDPPPSPPSEGGEL